MALNVRELDPHHLIGPVRVVAGRDGHAGFSYLDEQDGEWVLHHFRLPRESVDVSCLLLVEEDRLAHRVAVGVDASRHEHISVEIGQGVLGKAFAERTPVMSTTEGDRSSEGEFLRRHGIRAVYAVPLVADDAVIGVVQCGSRTVERIADQDATLFRAAAERIAAAIQQQRLREASERLASERDRSLQQRQLALDAARMGSYEFDPVSRRVTFDVRYAELYGLDGRAASLEKILRLIHPEDLPHVWAAVERALDASHQQRYTAQYRIIRPDGVLRWIEASGLPVFDRESDPRRAKALVGTVVDITDQKRGEEALRDADRQKNEFIGMLSHELRNPLSPIRQSVYILQRTDKESDQGRRALAVIDRQANHLSRLVDDLLDVTRISRGKLRVVRARVDLVGISRCRTRASASIPTP